jgi:aryl-alcohol dehydrogenase-like predicted oxidoreductase
MHAWEFAKALTSRAADDPMTDLLYTPHSIDRAVIAAAASVAEARGVSRAQIALAWLRRNPVVVASLVGATRPSHIEDAVASLDIDLTDDEVTQLEAPYPPRDDFQGISDDAELARISAMVGIKPAGA